MAFFKFISEMQLDLPHLLRGVRMTSLHLQNLFSLFLEEQVLIFSQQTEGKTLHTVLEAERLQQPAPLVVIHEQHQKGESWTQTPLSHQSFSYDLHFWPTKIGELTLTVRLTYQPPAPLAPVTIEMAPITLSTAWWQTWLQRGQRAYRLLQPVAYYKKLATALSGAEFLPHKKGQESQPLPFLPRLQTALRESQRWMKLAIPFAVLLQPILSEAKTTHQSIYPGAPDQVFLTIAELQSPNRYGSPQVDLTKLCCTQTLVVIRQDEFPLATSHPAPIRCQPQVTCQIYQFGGQKVLWSQIQTKKLMVDQEHQGYFVDGVQVNSTTRTWCLRFHQDNLPSGSNPIQVQNPTDPTVWSTLILQADISLQPLQSVVNSEWSSWCNASPKSASHPLNNLPGATWHEFCSCLEPEWLAQLYARPDAKPNAFEDPQFQHFLRQLPLCQFCSHAKNSELRWDVHHHLFLPQTVNLYQSLGTFLCPYHHELAQILRISLGEWLENQKIGYQLVTEPVTTTISQAVANHCAHQLSVLTAFLKNEPTPNDSNEAEISHPC